METTRRLSSDDLPVVKGRVYHLDLAPEELAQDIVVVGDPDRVPLLADELLLGREVDRCHRGFRTITGVARETGLRVSFVTSGIGAPSTEIVLNELAALNEINLRTMTRKASFAPLHVVRVGTSGGLAPATPVGTLVITDISIGLDNTGLFYDIPAPDESCLYLEREAKRVLDAAAPAGARFAGAIVPYAARADRELVAILHEQAEVLQILHRRGITVSSAGFFAEQGRGVARTRPTVAGLLDAIGGIDTGAVGLAIENMEMEAGFLLHFLGGLGYRAAVVCVVINKRGTGEFMVDYRQQVLDGARLALGAFRRLRR